MVHQQTFARQTLSHYFLTMMKETRMCGVGGFKQTQVCVAIENHLYFLNSQKQSVQYYFLRFYIFCKIS